MNIKVAHIRDPLNTKRPIIVGTKNEMKMSYSTLCRNLDKGDILTFLYQKYRNRFYAFGETTDRIDMFGHSEKKDKIKIVGHDINQWCLIIQLKNTDKLCRDCLKIAFDNHVIVHVVKKIHEREYPIFVNNISRYENLVEYEKKMQDKN